MRITTSLRRRAAIVSTLAAAMLVVPVGASSASAAAIGTVPAAAPQLSITITDDRDTTVPADESTYTIQVENLGTTDAPGLVVTQSVPEGMAFESADSAGSLQSAVVSWTLDLPAASTTAVTTTMTVGETSTDLLRLATVACAQETPTGPPIVCASDSNLLPAGAAAEAAAAAENPDRAPTDTASFWWILALSSGLVVALAGLVIAWGLRRRRRLRTAAVDGERVPSRQDSGA